MFQLQKDKLLCLSKHFSPCQDEGQLPTYFVKVSLACIKYLRIIISRVSDPHFFADPDPGKNLHADPDPVPDPDSGGIRGRGLGV